MEKHYMFKFYVKKPNGEVEFLSQVFRTERQMNKTMKRAILSAYGWAQLIHTEEQIDSELVGHEPTMDDVLKWTNKNLDNVKAL